MKISLFILISLHLGFCVCVEGQNAESDLALIDDRVLANAGDRPGDWMANGLNQAEDRFSPLKQITADNVEELGLVWVKKLGVS
jgi:glucose dehydrogenase